MTPIPIATINGILDAMKPHVEGGDEATRLAAIIETDLERHRLTLSPEVVTGLENERKRQLTLASEFNQKAILLAKAAVMIADPDTST
jgi:hypothetical protein